MSGADWTPERVRAARGERTQEAYAEALGVSRRSVAGWEAGESRPTRLARAALGADERQHAGSLDLGISGPRKPESPSPPESETPKPPESETPK